MGQILFFGFAAFAILGALAGQAVLAAAREHVRVTWPEWFDALAGPGGGLRLGGPAERARRRLLRPLLLQRLPAGPAGDEALLRMSALLRLALSVCAAGALGMALALWLRAATGG
jgi:hypothetical protein